jgi:hypothetical protein
MDVGYLSNPKIAALLDEHPRAILLHLECIAYAAQHLTDGIVPMRLAMRLACSEQCDLDLLLQSGLLIQRDSVNVEVRDYLEHQRSATEVKAAADKGRRAAEARWEDAQRNASSNAPSMPDALLNPMPREREEKEVKDSSSEIAKAIPDKEAKRDDVDRICKHLQAKIVENGSKRPNITQSWRREARLLLDRDGKTEQQIITAIDWCQADSFWKTNILSMPTLREKYDRIRLKAQEERDKTQRQPDLRVAPTPFTPEPPPAEIADDPEACDRWYRDQQARRSA